ncbi:MAG: hypothetical protein KA138_09340 [Saprospiraceae bacterium]|nr:hypothetical protein [Saprospiraceae bacterium]
MAKLILLFMLFINCMNIQLFAQETRWIDDIVPDSALDDSSFKICNAEEQIIQYFNDGNGVQYKNGKPAIDSIFLSAYQPLDINESGIIRIRFVVNCSGETGRFRLLSADLNYQPYQFSSEITSQLLRITKSMEGWLPKIWKDTKIDYYQYLIFKIEKGKLTHILP